NERQRRLAVAAEARALGRGGVSIVARASGLSRPTVYKAMAELDAPPLDPQQVRASGGGRKKTVQGDPRLLADLERLVDPATRGDPVSPLRWTTKSTRALADALGGMGHQVSHVGVGHLLHELHYSLQANSKVIEGATHPDRDAQFGYINSRVRAFLRAGDPVISVDTKKSVSRTAGPSGAPSPSASRMLSGLRSRWTTFSRCASASASATWASSAAATAGRRVPRSRRYSRRLPPVTRSITRPMESPAVSRSWTRTMHGWRSISRMARSCTNRATDFGCRVRSRCSSLTATSAPVERSTARHTVPVAPSPTGVTRMYEFPTRCPRRSTVVAAESGSTGCGPSSYRSITDRDWAPRTF